jgi:GMP synthase (glutamine-hydrolysing)
MSHGDKVTALPGGFVAVAETDSCPIAAMAHESSPFGIQFHPEVTHTLQGRRISSASCQICGCEALWTPARIVEDAIARGARAGRRRHVLLGLSGGVDSSVVAALLHRAIGDQLTCVFVDNGLLRLHEGDQVMEMFARNMGVRVIRADAEELFLDAPGRRRRPGAEAQDHRQHLHRGVRCRGSAYRGCAGWPRARSTRTSSSRPAPRPARPT